MTDSFFKQEPEKEPSEAIPDLDDSSQKHSDNQSYREDGFKTEEGRMAAILAYIPFLCFIPLLNMRESREAQFHARQGVLLFLIELLAVLFLIDGISDFVFKVVLVLAAALSIAGIIFALQGRNYRLPIIGDLADKSRM